MALLTYTYKDVMKDSGGEGIFATYAELSKEMVKKVSPSDIFNQVLHNISLLTNSSW